MLKKKVFRDIRKNLGTFIAIFIMTFLGVFVYTGLNSYKDGMQVSSDNFFEDQKFPDLFGYGFISATVENDLNNFKDTFTFNTKSTSRGFLNNHQMDINIINDDEISKLYVKDGIEFNKDKKGIYLDSYYAKKNNIKVGDEVDVKYNEKDYKFKVLSLVVTPEYLYDTENKIILYSDHGTYGFFYISSKYLDGFKNRLLVKTNNLKKTQEIINKLDSSIYLLEEKNHPSKVTQKSEIDQAGSFTTIFTSLFLFVAMLSVISSMNRFIKKERKNIGALKSLGFKDSTIIKTYLSYSLYISLIAVILGIVLGPKIIGETFLNMTYSYYEISSYSPHLSLSSIILPFSVIILIALVSYFTCHNTLKEKAAEIIRDEIVDRNYISNVNLKNANFFLKWNLRDIFRNKVRSLTAFVGIALCTMLLLAALGLKDGLKKYVSWQFDDLYKFNYTITPSNDTDKKDYLKLKKHYKASSEEILISLKDNDTQLFVDDSKNLMRYHDNNFSEVKLDGVYLTKKLSKSLDLKKGDEITFSVRGTGEKYTFKIKDILREPKNQYVYVNRSFFQKHMKDYQPTTFYSMKKPQKMNGVQIYEAKKMKREYEKAFNINTTLVYYLIAAATLLGVVIIYNLGILSLSEKYYQFATLKVLGFKDSKIKRLYIVQNIWFTIIGTLIGLYLGKLLTSYIFIKFSQDSLDIVTHITFKSYAIASLGTFLVSLLTNIYLSSKINKIDMVGSLKISE